MNKIFKVIWSKSKQCYIVVSEIAKNKTGKKKIVVASILVALAMQSGMIADVMAADPPSAKLADAALAVGTNGVAIGSSAKSQSNQSVAIGYFSNAQAPSASPENPATAVGAGANANGAGTVALGLSANATGANAVALGGGSNGGKNKTEATAVETTAVGFNAKASNSRAAAIGSGAGASGSDSIAMGTSTVADSEKAIAIGANSKGTAIGATALGRDTEASGASATALGALASAKGSTATAVGMQASASGTDSVAVGKTASATNNRALAVGTNAKATGENSVAVGSGAGGSGALGFAGSLNSTAGVVNTIRTINYATTADGDNAVALGFYANAKNSGVAVGQNALAATGGVAIGKGVLEDTGNNLAGGVVMGQDSATLGPYSLAMGFNAFASGSTSMAVGHTVSAQGAYAVAMGRKVSATGTSTAIGHHATATNGGLAIGSQENDASNDRTTASAKGAIAIGKNTKATSEDAVAIGTNAEANRLYSVALGSGSTTATGATNQGSTTINGITYNFAGATGNPNMQVSVGNTGATRQIKNVAAGEVSATSTDAINGSQLYAVASAVKPLKYVSINSTATGTGSNVDNDGAQAPNSIAIGPSSTVTNQNSVALGNNAQSLSDDSIAIGRNAKAESGSVFTNTSRAIAIGSNSRVATNVVQGIAIGSGSLTDEGAVVTGDQSIAIGGNVKVDGHAAIAIGGDDARKAAGQQVSYTNTNDNEVTGTLQTAILNLTGYNLSNYKGTAASHAGVAYGTSALAGNAGVAIGTASDSMTRMNDKGQVVNNKPVTNAVAIGTGARANFDNSVAIGGGSNTDHYATKQVNAVIDGVEVKWSGGENISPGDVVSFGAKGFERQLKNVAPGEVSQTSTDAVNGSQIYSLARKVTNIMNGGSGSVVNVNATGEPLSKVVTGTGASKVEKYYRTVDVKDDGTLVTGAVAQTPTSLALVNVDQTDTNKQTQTPRILGNVANGVKDNDAVNVSQLNAAKVKYFSVNSSDAGNINNDGATGTDAIAIGPSAVSNAVGSVALGKDAKANGAFTVALGGGNWQFKGAQANGVGTTALGSNTKTQENINYQTAIGFGATTSAESALALGYNAAASAQNAIALGKGAFTSGQDSLAFGVNSEAKGGSALAMGPSAQANSNYVVSLGYQANNGATNNANGVSIGWAAGMQSNGSSNVGIGSGAGRQISGNNNVSIGNGAGNLASANLYTSDSIMLGSEARAINGTASKAVSSVIAIGKKASGGADSAIALGQGASSTNQNSIAIGTNSQATAYNGVAIGAYSVANTAGGVAGFNPNTSRTDTYSGLTGRALTSTTGAVAIGSDSQSRQLTGLAAGTQDTDAVNVAQLKSVNLAFKGNAGTGDVNLAAHPLTIQGNDNYITTSANGNTINISGKVQNITVTNGTATAANKGMADAQNVADAINNAVQSNAYKWKLTANGEATPETIAKDDTVDFSGDTNISVARNGKKITTSLKKDITVDSVKVNKSITTGSGSNQITLDGTSGAVTGRTFSGQSFAAGDNVLSNTTLQIGSTTNGNNVTITKDGLTSKAGSTTAKFGATGIDAGGQRITNVSSGGNVGTNAANITDVKNAVSDVTLKLDTNSKTGTVKLSDGSLKIVGANGIRTDLTGTNKDNLVIGLDSNTVNATTKGIGLSGDSGTMLRKFLKDGDADFKISGDGNLVTTVGSAAGVKVSVDSTKVKDLAVEAVTVSKANTVDNPITVTPIASTNSKDYAIGIDTTKLVAKTNLAYTANGATAKTVSLAKGLNFVNGANTVATVDSDGKVSFDLNTATKNQINTNTTDIAANKGKIATNTTNIATNTANIAHTIALADDKGASTTAKSLKDGNVSFNIKGDNKYISTAASGNDVTLTVNEQAIKDAAKSASSFKVKANAHAEEEVKGGDTIAFNNGDNIEISQTGKTFTIGTAKNITVDSLTAGNTVINTSGLTNGTTAITGTGITTDKVTVGGISIDKTAGINAGSKVISNVASGGTTDSNAANIGDVKQAVANLSQNLNITDGTNNGTVDLKNQKLNVAGANGVTATVNNQTITVGLDANTVNATTKGIGLTADTGSTGNKYLKDGDVSFAVTGDGNLVSTSATAAGVKVAVDAAKVKDLAVSAVTVSKDTQADNPITVTPTAGTNSKDYAIGIDTTKLAAKTDLTYRANSAADANAKKVSLSKGLNFVDGGSTVATVDNDGKVSFDLNTTTKNQINTNTTDIAANKGNITKNTAAIATNTAALARNISLGADAGTASSQSLSTADVAFNVKGATGDFVSTNMNGNTVEISTKRATINSNATTGEASVTGNDGLATAKNVSDAINKAAEAAKAGAAWNITTNSSTTDKTAVKGGDTVDFINGNNIEITQDGTDKKKITVATKKDITVDSVTANNKVTVGSGANKITLDGTDGSVTGKAFTGTTFTGTSFTGTSFTAGNTVINTNGLTNGTTAITGTGVTTDNVTVGGISIDKTAGINAGNKVISNVASGGTTATNAANIGDVQNAVANLSQNLNITDGTHNGTVDLKNQKLNVAGTNGVTATVNNQTITVGLDADTVNATTKGIGLTADTGSTGNKYLKDGDVSFAVTGDGSLVSTSATAAGVKVAVNSASITAGTDGTITGPTTDGVATAKNVADAINAAKKASKTEITANTGEAANATTGNVTLTSTTAADGHTIYDVKLNDKVTLGSGANAVTIDGTTGAITGKTANIGGVTVNGTANTIGGLSNTTWNGTAVSGRAATEDQLKAATGATTLKFTGDVAANTGSVNLKDDTFGIKGDGKYISTDVNGKNVNLTVSEAEVKKSAVAAVTVSTDTTDANNPLTVTPTTSADGTTKDYKVTIDGTKIANKTNLSYKANDGTAKQVSLADGLNFKNGTLTTASINDAGVVKYDVNTATITAGADGTITGPTTDGVATAKNVADAINAAKKASKTEITANTGEAANATTGNVTLTSTTAADGHTIYDVKLNDKVTLGSGANTVTIDGTTGAITGKTATIGGVTVNGTANTIGGLSNTTWNGTAVSGRAATEDQLKAATGATTLKFTGDVATNTGSVNLKDDTFGIKGDGKYISTDVNGKNVNLTVSEAEVKKSAVAAVTVSTDTTDTNNPLTVTPTTSADGTTKDYKVTIDGTKIANKTNLSYKANDGTAKQVSLADGLNFKNGTLTTASIDDKGVVKYDVNTASITAGTDGTITGPATDGVATAKNVADAINAAKKASKTEITANTGEAANATTGNVTLTSTTAADGHTIYDVKLNDKVTLGTGANAVTVDGTAAKVTAGVTTVDGATGTITTGGTNSIKVDGATGTVTGLTNKDWTPGVTKAVTGRAATEDQLQKVADAASSQTWNITADKAGTTGNQTGTKKNATVGKDETVELVAGDNLTINQNERKFTYSLNKDLAGLTSVSIGTGTTETIKLDGATGKITAKNAAIGGVTVDGDNNHVTGLANTTWNGTATTGRAATEDQLKAVAETAKTTTDAVNLKFTGDTNTSPGVVNLKDDTFGIVGDGKYVSTDANGKNLTVKVSEAEVKKSAVAAVTVSTDTTDANNPLTVTPTTSADGTTKDYKVTIDGTKIANKTNLSYKANDGTAKQVSLADGLNFKNGTLTTASIDDNGVVKYDVNTAAITAGTDGTITGPTTDGVATAKNVADAINAAKKASKTAITANTGEAANATTGNVTLTSTTAADGHTIYDVKLNDKVTLGSGANAVTIDGTAGKATIGSSVINGVNNTFTTSGAKAVTLDGATGTITGTTANIGGVTVNGTANTIGGLSNTTWNGTATTGRAATEDQLKAVADAAGSQTWEITADKKAGTSGDQTGTKENAKVGKDDKVSLIAGENLTVDQAGKNFTYSLNTDLVKMNSATFEATGGKTTVIKGDSIVQTDGANVNTSNATSNTITDGTNTSTITAGKAQIGTVGIDGVASKITTGGANAVVINGADGTVKTGTVTVTGGTTNDITGLSNTTVTAPDFATKGRAATEEQLKAATGATTLKFTGDVATNTGSVNLKDDTFGIKGDGKYISTDVNGKNVNLTVSEAEVKKSAVAAVTVSTDTTDANNPLTVTPTTSADGTTKDYKVTIDGTKIANKTNLSYKANDGTAKQVSLADGLNFKNGTLTTASIDDNGVVKYDVNTASITAGTDGTITGPTTDGVATAQNVADAINAAKKASKTEITANTGEAANATTGNVTLTSTTAADGHTIYDVKLNDKVTLGSGANAVTIDGTAGKATIGSSIVDGINNTFTTGGTSPVTLNGATGTITGKTANIGGVTVDGTNNHVMGLANKDWTPGVTQAVSGRAATEDQLQKVSDAVGAGWKVNTGKVTGSTGESNGAASTKVASGEEVQFQAGNNLIVDQNGKTVAYSLNKALKDLESATFNGTGTNKTVITGDSITQTAGTQTNTSTAGGNTVADGTKSTETTAAGQVIKDGAKSNKSTVDNNVIDDGNGNVNTSNATSNTITDGTNTTATTSSSVTVKDNAGNSTVITKDNITTGVGGNKITLDGTAGKATVGASVIDGVNNTFTTGGANAVKLDGTAGTIKTGTVTVTGGTTNDITGLSNTTVTAADFATKGRAATEEQLKAVGEQTWQITADKDAATSGAQTGTKKDAKVGKDDKVQLIAGENMTVNQNERDFTFTLNKDLVKMNSATFLGTGSNTTVITGNSITQTAGTQTNTSTAGGNTVADGTKSTETTAAGQVIKDGTKTNTSTVDENTIVDGTKSNKSTVDGNTITDGTNTTETTSSSVTVKDNAGNSTVITKDNITTGVGANKVTLDGTAGKATIGSSVVDGVNNTFTTGGTNAVTMNGAAGTIKTGTVTVTGGTTNDITGLSNTTVTATDFATKGRAATEEQLKAVGEQTWQITADKDATTSGAQTGTKKDAKVGKDDKVQLIAGENMTVNQNERDFTYSLNKDLVKMNSATFEATGGKTTVIKSDSIVQTDGTKVNTSTAGGNTVADGTKSTATTADGTTVTSANGNTNYAADGVRINTTGKNPVSLTDVGLDNGNNVIKNVASGHVNNDATDNTNAANIADVKKATTTVTANAGEAANATKGNVTLTSTTATDGHTIYDVKLNDKVTLGTGANAVTIDGTAGKATVGSSVVDGVNNTFTTGGTNAVKLDGAAGTIKTGTVTVTGGTTNDITGLSNTTVTAADFATKGRAATEEQLKAVGEQTWQITADKDAATSGAQTGTKKDAKVGKDDKVQLIAGENMTVNQNERDFTFTLNKDLVKMNSATFLGTGSNTTVITGNSITQTAGTQTNTSTAGGNTVADGTKSTETTADGQVIKDGAKSNKSTVDNNVIDDGTGNVNTSNATSNTVTDGTNTTATTSSTVTVKDNAGNSTVITKDNITTGVGANKVTLDGTAGKATFGSSVVDGVNNTFTTGGANAVKLDGAVGTIKTGTVTVTGGTTNDITGLSNTTVTGADFATKGRAATEEQLKAVGEQTWQITADKDATTSGAQTGTKKDAKVGKDDKVQLIAGENMTVNQNERDFTFTLNKDLVKMNSATFLGTGSNTTVITGNSITQTAGTQTNTSTAGGNTVADGTKSTETTADGQVIKDGAKSNKSTVDNNVIDDGNGNVNTSNATSNTITDGTNTTATTSSSVTVKDNAGNSTVITKDNITTGVGGNKITLDGTAGKATVGASVVDGINNTFTTGGANAVKLDGVAGTIKTGTVTVTGGTTNDITGLANTTVNSADFATKGRAATEEQLKAVGEQTWQITADKDTATSGAQTGTKKDAKVGKDDKVSLIAGENMTINQNERDFTFTLNKDLVKMNSATFLGTGSNTTVITGNSITQTAGTQTNTSTAGGNTVADGTKSTETTAAGQVIKDGAKTNKSTVDTNVIDDGNGNKNISNATSNTITDGTNTSTITAGKANIGNIAVDGVNNKITMGNGANPVTLDGANGHLDGLTNTTWVPGVTKATTGRAATEDQLQQVSDAVGAGWKVNTGTVAGSSGVSNGAASTKVSSGEEVKLQAGDNLVIDQNGKTVSYSLNKDLTKMNSATFEATGGKTTVIKGDSIIQTDGGKTNTSTAAGNTVVDGNKSTATTAAGTTITDGAKTNTSTADKNVINDGVGNTNTSTATSNTLKNAAGDETKADAKGVTVKDAAGNNATFNKDGITITKTGKDTVSLTSNGLDNGNNKIVNVAAGVANTDAVNVGQLKEYAAKSTTELTANGGQPAGSTTGNIVLTKTTAADGHTIYDNKLNDKITLGTDPTKAVTVDGTTGTVTGLTNKTWTPGSIVSGRAATEDQLKEAVADSGWKAAVDKEGSGQSTVVGTSPEKIKAEETVTFKAGNNMMVTQTGKSISYAVNPELTDMKSATFKDAAGNTTVTNGNGITITPGSANPTNPHAGPVSLTKDGLNNGNNQIKGVAPGTDLTDAVNVSQLNASNANTSQAINQIAGEVQHVGAHAAAMAALKPIQYDPLEPTQVMAGVGNYRGETAAALGLAHYTNENTMFNVGVSVGGNHNMVNAGVTHKFGYSPEKKNIPDRYKAGPISSVYVMQDEVSSLKKENAEQKYVIADQAARLTTLEAENEQQRRELAETKKGLDDLKAAVDKLLASKG